MSEQTKSSWFAKALSETHSVCSRGGDVGSVFDAALFFERFLEIPVVCEGLPGEFGLSCQLVGTEELKAGVAILSSRNRGLEVRDSLLRLAQEQVCLTQSCLRRQNMAGAAQCGFEIRDGRPRGFETDKARTVKEVGGRRIGSCFNATERTSKTVW